MAYTFLVYDELGGKMRQVKRKEEAQALIEIREGWTFKRVQLPDPPKPVYEDAPF